MRALVYHGPGEISVEDRRDPQPGPAEVLLEITATGICGSVLHGYTGENKRNSMLDRIPAGRLGQPEDPAGPVVFLASEEAAYVNGAELLVDGGLFVNLQ